MLTAALCLQVTAALTDQIRSLPVLVEEFRADFNPTRETLELYKSVSTAGKLLTSATLLGSELSALQA